MSQIQEIRNSIFNIQNEDDFNDVAIQVYQFQTENCEVYQRFQAYLKIDKSNIKNYRDIPFLPIQFFKSQEIICKGENAQCIFTSSATTGSVQSKHLVSDIHLYEESFIRSFELFYGNIHKYCILALLPNYYEREGSSLVYMVNHLIEKSKENGSGYFLHQNELLYTTLLKNESEGIKTILIGVSYALLDFLDKYPIDLKHTIIMETGGMKGKRKELLKEQLHSILCDGFGVECIHSEYGMTELMSQAYSNGKGIFTSPPWMKILVRDIHEPLRILQNGKSGGVNVIDLANLYSCSFIATDDLGKNKHHNSFEIIGRIDNSDVRGCNLMIE
jgi:hypothetical protein